MPRRLRNARPPLLAVLPLFAVLCFAAGCCLVTGCAAGVPGGTDERAPADSGQLATEPADDEASAADGTAPSVEEPAVANQQPEANEPFTLGGGRAELTVEAPVAATAASGEDDRYLLVLDDLELLAAGAYYQVYVNLPQGAEPDPDGPHFVGNLSLFGPTPEQRGEGEGALRHSESFDVSDAVRELAAGGGWDGEVQLTFVRGNPAPATAADEPEAFIRVGEASVVRRD
ncbi:MAG TPA: hypothetical protein VKU40_09335 [Thermoanaerobaculia bacterium]|nr:hypothetical protein [Thermoanaerobaculia bacterium]